MNRARLRHFAQINPPSPAFDRLPHDAELTFLPMENIWPDGRLDLSQRRPKSSVTTGYTRFQHGDILVPKISPTFEASRSVLITDGLLNGVGAGTTELHILRAGPEIEPRFLLYVTHSHPFLKMGEAAMNGVAGQKRVPDDFIRNFLIDITDLEEQRRIADFLDHEIRLIGRMNSLLKRMLGKLTEREQALIDLEIVRLSSKYGTVPFRRAIQRIEQGISPQCDSVPAQEHEWGVLKLSSIKRGSFFPEENKRLPEEVTPDQRYEVRIGDLLVTRANTPELVGDVAVVTHNTRRLLLPDLIYRVTLSQSVLPEFASLAIMSSHVRGIIRATARGTSQSMVKLRGEDIREWPIPKVDKKLQIETVNKIAKQQESIKTLRHKIMRQLDLLDERRKALITAAVAGQIDVATARGSIR